MDLRKHSKSVLGLLCWLVAVVGCGSGEIPRYHISGTVTYKGKPLSKGTITFVPTEQSVQPGFANIIAGKYDTAQDGVGHIAGPQTVTITGDAGGDVKPDSFQADSYVGKPMFPTFETKAHLPKQRSTKDFAVK